MATKKQKIQVGIFLVVGLAVIVAVFIVISEISRQPMEKFHIGFKESVSGLTKDSNVLYQGVPVGKVEDIHVTSDNEILAEVGIFTDHVRLREGTVATLQVANLMGGMVIELSGGDPGAPALKPGSTIPSQTSILENIAQDLPRILEEIKSILSKLNYAIGDVEGGKLGELVRDTDAAVRAANRSFAEMDNFLKGMNAAVSNTEYEVSQTMKTLREAIVEIKRTFTGLSEDPSSVIWGRPRPKHPYVR